LNRYRSRCRYRPPHAPDAPPRLILCCPRIPSRARPYIQERRDPPQHGPGDRIDHGPSFHLPATQCTLAQHGSVPSAVRSAGRCGTRGSSSHEQVEHIAWWRPRRTPTAATPCHPREQTPTGTRCERFYVHLRASVPLVSLAALRVRSHTPRCAALARMLAARLRAAPTIRGVPQHSMRKRAGFSTSSLMRLRKVTASLPSISLWS